MGEPGGVHQVRDGHAVVALLTKQPAGRLDGLPPVSAACSWAIRIGGLRLAGEPGPLQLFDEDNNLNVTRHH